jgi:hypothetical protein
MKVVITPEMLRRWATQGDEELTASGRLAIPSEAFLKRKGRKLTARRTPAVQKQTKATTTV